MAFVKRTAKCDRAYLSTGKYTSVVNNLIPPNPSGMRVTVQSHEMSLVTKDSTDSTCMMAMQVDTVSLAVGTTTDEGNSYY
jgi:hypothetical protein